jgi:hypothetical protein
MFSAPRMPAIPPVTPAPDQTAENRARMAAAAEAERTRGRAGERRASPMLGADRPGDFPATGVASRRLLGE